MSKAPPPPDPARAAAAARSLTFLSNHAHVLMCLAAEPDLVLREVAARVGVTERAVQNIVADLEAEGLVTRHREGRRNRYELRLDCPLRHPLESHRTVHELIRLVTRRRRA
jgi:DNA-binding transcriptional ArsR family regulator